MIAAGLAVLAAAGLFALNVNDYRADAARLRGLRLAGEGDADGAEQAFHTAVRLSPWEPVYRVDLAGLCAARAEAAAPARGEPLSEGCLRWLAEAETHYRRAIALEPANYQTYLRLGPVYALWAESDPRKAAAGLRLYQDAADTTPGRQHVYWEWGNFYLALGRPADALERYHYALSLDPGVAASHRELGRLLVRLGDPRAAERSYETAWAIEQRAISPRSIHYREIAPRRAAEHAMLAELFLRAGDRARAVHHLRATLALDKRNVRARELLARIAAVPPSRERKES